MASRLERPRAALHRHRRRRDERPGAGLPPARRPGDRQRPRRELVPRRLRDAGLEPRIGHDADARAARAPRWSSRPRSATTTPSWPERASAASGSSTAASCSPSCARCERLIAVAGTHGKTTTAGMLVHALRGTGADPAFLLGGELPGRRARTAGPRTPAGGRRRVGRRRGRRVGRELPRAAARDRGDHQRRARPPLALGLARRAARRRSRGSPSPPRASCSAPTRTSTRSPPRRRARGCASTPSAPGPAAEPARSRAATTCSTRAPRSPPLELAGLGPRTPAAAALASFPGMLRRQQRKGERARGRDLRRLRPSPDRGRGDPRGAARAAPAAADRGLPAAPVLAHQGARAALRRRAGGGRRGRRARRLPGPRAAGRRARRASAGSTVARAAADHAGGPAGLVAARRRRPPSGRSRRGSARATCW